MDGDQKTAPKPADHLNYVAWAFFFIGGLALMQTAQAFITSPTPVPNFLMVFLVVGWGLMRRKPLWRTFALSCAYVMVIFYVGNLIMVIMGNKIVPEMGIIDTILFWAINIFTILVNGYAIWALQLKSVRDQFEGK